MLSIGEFARLAGVSVRMLRHYDQLDLLRPRQVDPHSGYRSYAAAQLARANQLIGLKDLGFTLEQVGVLLDGELSEAEVVALMRARRDALRAQIETDEHRLATVEARLRSIEKENPMSEFVETPLPELVLVQQSVRIEEMSQVEEAMSGMFQQVNHLLGDTPLRGPGVATYTADGDGMIAAAAEQIGDAPTPDGLESATVAAEPRALTVRYSGPDLSGIQQAWQGLVAEVEARGLTPRGTCREVYDVTPFDGGGAGWSVDLQQPVA
ncbi:MerR family transcriptional regulator [Serinicoccus kebangsaanensis]|uniref:MerR family transcriptional regulator n=1 Tax=Serinicoccus kebangsaanensis TaxID=2602069 RepID=UPI00124F2E52|nr:MerR family transcriptional regulator [Serinicoccus kebangsaanensis]